MGSFSSETIPAGWSFPGQSGGKVPVAQIGATPFGAEPEALAAWLHVDGGLEIVQRGFDPPTSKFWPATSQHPSQVDGSTKR